MKNRKVIIRLISWLILVSFLTQSCRVYHRKTVYLDDIVGMSDVKFKKIKTTNGVLYHLRRIEIRDGDLYGSKKKVGDLELVGFTEEDIISIRVVDKSTSIAISTMAVLGSGIAVAFAIYLITFDLSL